MFNTFASTLRPDDFKAALVWLVALLTALVLRASRMALATTQSSLLRSGTLAQASVRVVGDLAPVPRLEACWTRAADGQLRCQWRATAPRLAGNVIVLHRPPPHSLHHRQVA